MTTLTPAQIAQVCHAAHRALRTVQAGPDDTVPEPWEDLTDGERRVWVSAVERELPGYLAQEAPAADRMFAALVTELSDTSVMGPPSLTDRLAVEHPGWSADRVVAEAQRTALGVRPRPTQFGPDTVGQQPVGGDPNRIEVLGEVYSPDEARAAGFVPKYVTRWSPEWVQADGFVVRGLFHRGDAQRFDTDRLRDLVSEWLALHGVKHTSRPEAFTIAHEPEMDLHVARKLAARDKAEAQERHPAAGMEINFFATRPEAFQAVAERIREYAGSRGALLYDQGGFLPPFDGREHTLDPAKPSVGRIVHYVSHGTPGGEYGKECRAAQVTELTGDPANPGQVGLFVANPTGLFLDRGVPEDQGRDEPYTQAEADDGARQCDGRFHAGGTWHWPVAR